MRPPARSSDSPRGHAGKRVTLDSRVELPFAGHRIRPAAPYVDLDARPWRRAAYVPKPPWLRRLDARARKETGHAIARYPDLSYRDVFWAQRPYEDQADRLALRALLPPRGGCLLDVGAGFGRLADEYVGWRDITLLDSSAVHVAAARETFEGDARIRVGQGDAYQLPFGDAAFDAVVCVRVLHHLDDPDAAFREIARVIRPGGTLVLEYANKRHLKAMLRQVLGFGGKWDPRSLSPFAWKPLHVVRHPRDVARRLSSAGFQIEAERTASLFRWSWLSHHVPLSWLMTVERPLQTLLAPLMPGPSVWVRARKG
jgi:SAM-dependent methyltransferase